MAATRPQAAPRGQLTGQPSRTTRGLPTWNTLTDEIGEDVDALRWPNSTRVWPQVLNDDQVAAMDRLLAVAGYRYTIDPGSLPPDRVRQPAGALGMPLASDPSAATRRDLNASSRARTELIEWVSQAATLTHSLMEIVGGPSDDKSRWDLHRLVPLSNRTISHWQFKAGGTDVEWLEQPATGRDVLRLPSSRLLIARWGHGPDHPYGRSLLRPLYRNWVSKDRMIRVEVIAAQRNGMGVPTVTMAEDAQPDQRADYDDLVTGVAAGEDTGLTLPYGATFQLTGVTGNTHNTIGSIRYHDEGIARALGGMLAQLGQTSTGSRALGDTFEALLWTARDRIADWVASELEHQVLDRWAAWNFDTVDEPPRIEWMRPEGDERLSPDDWELLATAGLIDQQVARDQIARRYKLPEPTSDRVGATALETEAPTPIAAARLFRRRKTEAEEQSRWDFQRLEDEWAGLRDHLVTVWRGVRAAMIGGAVEALAATPNVEASLPGLHSSAFDAATATVAPAVLVGAAERTARTAQQAAQQAADALNAQGASRTAATVDHVDRARRDVDATVVSLGHTVADQVSRRAQDLAAPDTDAVAVAAAVETDLAELTDAHLTDLAGSAATRAQNAGLFAELAAAEADGEIASYYYSSLLDQATCTECSARDGREYRSLEDVRQDFPTGGYRECLGRSRCRCTPVAILAIETPATERGGA